MRIDVRYFKMVKRLGRAGVSLPFQIIQPNFGGDMIQPSLPTFTGGWVQGRGMGGTEPAGYGSSPSSNSDIPQKS
jgi:hypothetical protein